MPTSRRGPHDFSRRRQIRIKQIVSARRRQDERRRSVKKGNGEMLIT
jgi:hypothetical protein